MKVIKFGGTSVGSAEGLTHVKKIAESEKEPVIVVVSALGGVTDLLLQTAAEAGAGDKAYAATYERIVERHRRMVRDIVPPDRQEEICKKVNELLDELKNIYKGVYLIKDLSPKTNAAIVSYGERLSSIIVSGLIRDAVLFDSRDFIKTEPYFSKHIVDFGITNRLIARTFSALPRISVVQGFISSDKTCGDITNLGRGGSDYTAAILAAALNADELVIYTDVDGFMTADPRIINTAYLIERLSFVEAMELCNFGAKVIYPPTIYPAYHKNIPIIIRNTYNPGCAGTYISREKPCDPTRAIKGISSINDTCLITIQGLGMVGVIGVNYRIFKVLAKAGVSVFLVSQASSENTTSIGIRTADCELALEVLRKEFAQEITVGEINDIKAERGLATVAIVGENMKHTPGIAGKLFGTLGRNGINVIACAQGASETNISFVVKHESLKKALNVIHDSFFLSEYQELNIFLTGVGLVGHHLLEQIRKQQPRLLEQNALKINIVGISNSKRSLFDREGIDLSGYRERLESAGVETTPEKIRDEIVRMNIFNSVFVDCTASPEVAGIYKDLLEHNVSVVTANKIAASSDYRTYAELKEISRKRGIKFLFETNVGAGLPIINTINDLINSGDRILKMEAVLSGTLNYIFNELSGDVPFSRTIQMARDAGYAEPDPRIDLSGMDVVRKLVILAREAGYRVEQADVEKHLFVPDEYFRGSLEEFWKNIPRLDAAFEEKRRNLAREQKRLRFVARFDHGKAEVGLREVDIEHPFYDLEGSNNIIEITTERYKEYPMQIKGYGAGASVTAAGVFADIISIANIR